MRENTVPCEVRQNCAKPPQLHDFSPLTIPPLGPTPTRRNAGFPLVFSLSSANLDALFRKAKARALIDDLHFHDTRHEGITRLSRRLPILALARAVGHRDLRMLQIYYNESGEDLAKMLD